LLQSAGLRSSWTEANVAAAAGGNFGVGLSGVATGGEIAPAAVAALTQWTAQHDAHSLMATLQAAGIAAGVVQDIEDLLEHDPTIRQRGSLVPLEHAVLGTFGHVRTPITFSNTTAQPFRPPSIGEHSHAIALEIAGLTPERVQQLESLGVFQ